MPNARCSTRLQRVKKSPTPEKEILSSERGTNSTGLAVLPDELLLEILSYYPPLPHPTTKDNKVDAQAHIERRERLLALSRTCSNLRRFFSPYIWERIEVCEGMRVGNIVLTFGSKKDDKEFALELVRQLEIVTIRDVSLAQHVKIINVDISSFSIHSVLLELARCMGLFDNLHTAKINMNLGPRGNDLSAQRAFRKYNYPQIRNVIVSRCAYPLLSSCPQVRTVLRCGHPFDDMGLFGRTFIPHLRQIPHVEILDFDLIPAEFGLLTESCPVLREISFDGDETLDHISKLDGLKHLQTIKLKRTSENEVLNWAKRHLLSIQNEDKKEKRVITAPALWLGQTVHYLPAPLPGRRNAIASYVEQRSPRR